MYLFYRFFFLNWFLFHIILHISLLLPSAMKKIHIVWSLVLRCIIYIVKVQKSNLKDYYKYIYSIYSIYSILFAVSFALLILFNCL